MKTKYIVFLILILAILAGSVGLASAASSTVSTILASADTYIDSSRPATNFGTIYTAWVRGGSPTRRALLRFNLGSIPAGAQITGATLKLYVSSDGSPVAGTVNAVGGSWSENTVTYSAAPALGALVAALPNPATPSASVSVSVTSYVAGKTTVDLYIASSSSDGVVYYAREKGSAYAPRLVVTWSPPATATATRTGLTATRTPTLTPTPAASATRTSTPRPTATGAISSPTYTPTSRPTTTGTVASPTSTATPGSPVSLSLPLRLAFYYPWFPEGWAPGTVYTPSLGYYDGSNASILAQHVKWMQYARMQGAIASWWGPSTSTDSRIPLLLSAAASSGFKWALYYEPEGQGDPAPADISAHLAYIYSHYAQNSAYLYVGGKPVIFVFGDGLDGCSMVDRWKAANTQGFYLVLKVFAGYAGCVNQPDNWHQFAPAAAYDQQGSHSVSISPGYWKKGSSELLARSLSRWNENIRTMVAARPDFQLVTTWNGWAEGNSAEPSIEYRAAYIDALHNDGQVSPPSTPSGSDPTIMAAGDIICDSLTTSSAGCQQMAVSQIAVNGAPDKVLILGDLCHTPSANCFNNYYSPSWGRVDLLARPVTGNHDYLVPGGQYYFDYWNGIGIANGLAGERSKAYYSYDVGAWHVVALNSQCEQAGGCGPGTPQYVWLQQDLQSHANLCTLAYYHIPVFSSGGRGEENMRQIYTLLYNYNADVVLDGHDHIYERFAPQSPSGVADALRGIREFIVGTGGANHTFIETIQPNSEVRNADTFGVLKLTLHPDRYDWVFLPVPGRTFTDSGTSLCH